MIEGTYDIIAQTPIGEKKGKVTLTCKGNVVKAKAKVLGLKLTGEGTVDGDSFSAAGEVRILTKSLKYKLAGMVVEDFLTADATTSKGNVHIDGIRR